jgi:hypothetical protein
LQAVLHFLLIFDLVVYKFKFLGGLVVFFFFFAEVNALLGVVISQPGVFRFLQANTFLYE